MKQLKSIQQFCEQSGHPEGRVRWWRFNQHTNGMAEAGVFVKFQGRVYVDVDAYDAWVSAQQQVAA